MPAPGIIIGVETSGAINNLGKFQEALTKSGASAKLTAQEVQKLEESFNEKLKADEAAKKIELARKQVEQIGRAAGLSAVEVRKLGDSMGVNMTHMNANTRGASSLASATSMLGGSFSTLAPAIGGAVLAYMSLSKAIEGVHAYMSRGIDFNKQMESSALGIASIITATQEIKNLDGQRLQGQEKLNASMSIASGLMNDIQVMGLQTTATTKELVQGFQSLIGPASQAGLSLSQTKEATVTIVQAMAALGVNTAELAQEGRALLTGDIDRNARLAQSLQITNQMVESWKEQGTLFQNLMAKMEAFKLAGAATATTWAGLSSNLSEAADTLSGMGTKGVFEGSKQAMDSLINGMVQLKDGSVTAGNAVNNIAAGLQSIDSDLGGAIASSAETLVQKFAELNDWVGRNKGELSEIYDKTVGIGESFLGILGSLGNMLTTFVSVGVETGAFSTALTFAHGIVVMIQEVVGYVELAFRSVGLVILKNVCGPLASAGRLAAQLGGNVLSEAQLEGLNKWSAGLEDSVAQAEKALGDSAARYKDTPFPAMKAANEEVEKFKKNLAEAKKGKDQFTTSSPTHYNAADSAEMMKGTGTAQYQLNKAWEDGIKDVKKLDAILAKQDLSGEDRVRALNDQKEAWGRIGDAQTSYEKKANAGSKAADRAALAAERYGEAAAAFYNQTMDSMDQIHDSLTGGTEKNALQLDKSYSKIFDQIRQKVVGAKGDVSAYAAVWVEAEKRWPGDHMLAVIKDTSAELKKQAQIMREIADATGDPQLMQQAGTNDVEAWYTERKKQIADLSLTEQEKTKLSEQLESAKAAKLLKGRADAYAGVKAVSSEYWNAEKQLIEANLATVKANATDETAYKIYEAQRWDEFYKAQMEQQAATAGSFAETLAAKWSLAFGGYESETTKTKKRWDQMSDSIVNSTNGMIDGIAGGFGDLIRNIGNGTVSIEDLWKNMLSRMLDMFASFVEDLIKQQLKNLIGGMLTGSTTGTGTGSVSIGSLTGGASGGSGTDSVTSLKTIGKTIGESVMGSFSSGSGDASNFLKSLSKTNADGISDVFKSGNLSGWTFSDGSSVTGSAVSEAAGLSSASSILGTVGSVLGVVGAIGGVVGLVSSLFGGKEEEKKKTASGYNVGYNAGHATSYGVDFYSDGSVVPTGASDPDVQKKIADAFRNTAEALSDFAEELGFAVDVLDGFSMPSMNVTSDQLDGYIRNGENMMAFKGLMESGMRGAFDAVARDGEVYSDEYERLATSLSVVKGGFEAYGYELSDVAQISQQNIDDLRIKNTEVANGTADAMRNMATSMGATADVLAQITDESTYAAAALGVTDEQLSNVLEADYASEILDAVGGEEAFNTIMGNVTKNIFDSIGAYAENLDYYTEKAGTAISKLGDASVTVDNFWIKFDEAIKGGLSVDQFEAWGKASSWVANINSVEEAMSDWNDAMTKTSQSLDQRMAAAQGYDYQAKLAKQMADAEWELVAAREAGYDAAMLAQIQAVQAAELAATIAKHQADYADEVMSAQERIATATDDQWALIEIQRQKNDLELQEMSKTYNWSPGSSEEGLFKDLQQAQSLEISNMIRDIADALEAATTAMNNDLAVREAKLAGNDDLAEAISMSNSAIEELNQAYEDGLDEATIARLIGVQNAEMEAYLASIDSTLVDVEQTVSELLDSLLDQMNTLIDAQIETYQEAQQSATDLASAYHSAAESIYDTLNNWAIDDSGKNADQTFADNKALFDAYYAKAMAGDSDAFSALSTYASSYREAGMNKFGSYDEYQAFYRDLQEKMGAAAFKADELGDKQSDFAKLYDVQLDLLALWKEELSKEDPNTGLLATLGNTMSLVQQGINTGNTYQATIKSVTDNETGTGGYKSIISALGTNNSALSGSILTMTEAQSELMALLEKYLNASKVASLTTQVATAQQSYTLAKEQEVAAFRNSELGSMISRLAVSSFQREGGGNQSLGLISEILKPLYYGPSGNTGISILEWLNDPADVSGSRIQDIVNWRTGEGYGSYSGSLDWSSMWDYVKNSGKLGNIIGDGGTGIETVPTSMWSLINNTTTKKSAYETLQKQLDELIASTSSSSTLSASSSYDAINGIATASEATTADVVSAVNTLTYSSDTSQSDLLAEIKALREEVAALRKEATSDNAKKITLMQKNETRMDRIENTSLNVTVVS